MQSPVKIWRNQKNIQKLVGKTGSIIAWTTIRVPQAGFAHFAPYPIVLVDLAGDKQRVMLQLVDYDPADLRAGGTVELVVRRIMEPTSDDVIPYGIKAKPIKL
jgi:uncharacterized OB-fold protein